jgi:phosphatidylethanolamine/phosphatidyl-N-methylethanolamine N-methyltransferase
MRNNFPGEPRPKHSCTIWSPCMRSHLSTDHRMAIADTTRTARRKAGTAPWLFFRRWLANPVQMGSITPSSPALCRLITQRILRAPDEYVLELGAGTGVISRAVLEAGVPADRLVVVEIVPAMARILRQALPGVTVIEGDAWQLSELLPQAWHGRIGTVICGIPLVLLSRARQHALVDAIEAVAPGRGFLHFSYCATSPLPHHELGLTARRQSWTAMNFPPASVWRYAKTNTEPQLHTTARSHALNLPYHSKVRS